ncbi:VanZ family protein [Geoalkalibacter halelectricus]|uniref:VanZ family protein n=1 Tax=Geoalkalibacter halelectricus TaxID=2847045 RepID=A0ABY5ZW52_9BACT|nr:VanZ family protein [Geoalkalibacter halelectricus]MDO3377635.1 VanZ family protein [Geoalkalibacter halelectricus]UWZ81426.1 VanZ family protein [Geoalkalibacter halelectricus]
MPQVRDRFSPAQRRIAVVLPLLLMVAIFGLSSISFDLAAPEKSALGWMPPTLQNFLHIPLYGFLAFLWFGALAALGVAGRTRLVAAGLIAFSYGVLDELYQTTVPGRFGSLSDVAFNSLGIVLALWFCSWFQRRFWR